jgi:uncharacterized protein (TIGR03118 family)
MERLEGRQLFTTFIPLVSPTLLVSNGPTITAPVNDANLVDSWGTAITPTGDVWVANNATDTATVYTQSGLLLPSAAAPLAVSIPAPAGATAAGPTGMVYHGGRGFNVTVNGVAGASAFLFATDSGTIDGWSQKADPAHAVIAVDHSAAGDVFKGLTEIGSGTGAKIYATDFAHGHVEVFNSGFQQVKLKAGAFADGQVPSTFAPFGIQVLAGKIYVTYAKQNGAKTSDVPGPANGIVDVFNTSGKLLKRVATGGDLNSPWGMAIAPSTWGAYRGDLLVGNVGDGTINVFDKKNNFLGQVFDPNQTNGTALTLPGLWSLNVGVKAAKNTLFFTAGGQSYGVLGGLTARK